MARWLDQLTTKEKAQLKTLCRAMRDIKPDGWSVVWRVNEISIRPSDRALGRFSAVSSERHEFLPSFFCREAGIWNKHRQFSDSSTVAAEIVHWMIRATHSPNREERDGHTA